MVVGAAALLVSSTAAFSFSSLYVASPARRASSLHCQQRSCTKTRMMVASVPKEATDSPPTAVETRTKPANNRLHVQVCVGSVGEGASVHAIARASSSGEVFRVNKVIENVKSSFAASTLL